MHYTFLLFFFISCAKYKPNIEIKNNSKPVQSSPYRLLSSFKNDTAAYLAYNFVNRSAYYRNKPLKEVLDDVELSLQKVYLVYGNYGHGHPYFGQVIGLTFLFERPIDVVYKANQRFKGRPNGITILFEKPLDRFLLLKENNALVGSMYTEKTKWIFLRQIIGKIE